VLAPNNFADATVTLDGSQSSDADNDPLQFYWYADGQTNLLSSSALATNQFSIGQHTLTLVVSDGQAPGTPQVSFEVITPGMAVGKLAQLVSNSEFGSRNDQPLLATLAAAQKSFDRSNTTPALDLLIAFQSKVRGQIAPENTELANELIAAT